MKPLRESSLQRAIRLENEPPSRAFVFVRVVKRISTILLLLSFIVFMLLMLPTAVEILLTGMTPESFTGGYSCCHSASLLRSCSFL